MVGRRIDRSIGEALRGLDRLVVPTAVALVELIMGVDAQQLVVKAALRGRCAIGRDGDDIERGAGAVGERAAGELRLDADHAGTRRHRDRNLMLDGAAARLGHAQHDLRFERMRARRQSVELDGKACFALRIGVGQVFERLLDGLHGFVGEAELVTGKAGAFLRHSNGHVAFQIEIGRWSAVEKAP